MIRLFIFGLLISLTLAPNYIFAQDMGSDSLQQQMQNTVQGTQDVSSSLADKVQSTASESAKYSGCLIATASFGSEIAPQVQMLREIRDKVLLHTTSGAVFMTAFNQFYYTFSPTVAEWERGNDIFKEIVKTVITPLVTTLSIFEYFDIDSEGEVIFYGLLVILFNVGIYFVLPIYVSMRIKSYVVIRKQNRKMINFSKSK